MTRYLIQFADKTTKHLSEAEGKAALASWAAGKPVIIRGAGFAHHIISAIRPITKDWYDREYVAADRRLEESQPQQLTVGQRKQLSDGKLLRFSDAEELNEAKNQWVKASAVPLA